MKYWVSALSALLSLAAAAATASSPLTFSRFSLSAKADLGEVTFTYHFTPVGRSVNAGIQIFLRRDDGRGQTNYELIAPKNADGQPLVLNLFEGLDNSGTFKASLKKGTYSEYRVLLFRSPDGKSVDYQQLLYDTARDGGAPKLTLNLVVTSESKRVTAPVLFIPGHVETTGGPGEYAITIPGEVRMPPGYTAQDGGFWVMAKGSGGFSQVWAAVKDAQPGRDPDDPFQKIPVKFELKGVKPGLWNVQFGLFKSSFGDPLQWLHPGLDFETGGDSWVKKAPKERIPPRLRVRGGRWESLDGKPFDFYRDQPQAKRAVSFVRGGNYGNAITWTIQPELNTPGYFTLLKGIGVKWVRVNFNQDRYPGEPLYQHAVDQVVQNIWSAGLYPILCPQGLPKGDQLAEQLDKGQRVVEAMARKYRGESVWLQVCNEPHEVSTWAAWKPVAQRYVRAIRAIDPDAFVIVPFEGYQKDGRAAAKDPIVDPAVDLYDGHAYVEPADLGKLFGTPILAGLPVLIGEYGGDAAYLSKMNSALEQLPKGLMAAGPWAFTVKGQDSLPLVLDGSTAELKLTPAGQAIADDYAAWDAGRKRKEGTPTGGMTRSAPPPAGTASALAGDREALEAAQVALAHRISRVERRAAITERAAWAMLIGWAAVGLAWLVWRNRAQERAVWASVRTLGRCVVERVRSVRPA